MRFFSVLAVTAVALGILGWLVRGLGISEPLTPSPEAVVQGFIVTLASGRYEPAHGELSDELKLEAGVEELRRLNEALQARYGGYKFELGGQEHKQRDRATYQARIKTERGETLQPNFELERDPATGEWGISGFNELAAAAER